jgi:L,D-peptidoglycan transpeptidase YkuD (ErfK/YbiS/YcfS/YnhG family)
VPPEAGEADVLDQALRRAGVPLFAEKEYEEFRSTLKSGQRDLAREKAKFGWFRNYEPVQAEFRNILQAGAALLDKIEKMKSGQARILAEAWDVSAERVRQLKRMTDYFNENGEVRKNLARAEISLAEARLLINKEDYDKSRNLIETSERHIRLAVQSAAAVLNRYLKEDQLATWRIWTEEAISESKSKGIIALVVFKLERKLHIYRGGVLIGSYDIGLGRYGLSDKLFSGDEATPEGKYHIVKKYPNSEFYKALLINYPNDEDRAAYASAKKNGKIPSEAGIGGFIEIHGGGKDSLTKGCVGLENKDMDHVYGLTEVGTPVTIVGAVSMENSILADLKKFEERG